MRRPTPRQVALVLAALQAADLVYTEASPKYGPAHLDNLGVPTWLRPLLPVVKAAAVIGLLTRDDRRRAAVALPLVSYYSAAATFHLLSDDTIDDVVPAVFCAALAAVAGLS